MLSRISKRFRCIIVPLFPDGGSLSEASRRWNLCRRVTRLKSFVAGSQFMLSFQTWGSRLVPPPPGSSAGPVVRGSPARPARYEHATHLDPQRPVVGEAHDAEDRAGRVHGSREEIGAAGILGAVRFRQLAGWGNRRAPSRRGSRRGRERAGGWLRPDRRRSRARRGSRRRSDRGRRRRRTTGSSPRPHRSLATIFLAKKPNTHPARIKPMRTPPISSLGEGSSSTGDDEAIRTGLQDDVSMPKPSTACCDAGSRRGQLLPIQINAVRLGIEANSPRPSFFRRNYGTHRNKRLR